jgi:hypothetical protein
MLGLDVLEAQERIEIAQALRGASGGSRAEKSGSNGKKRLNCITF